jgi:cyclohexadienyl dehydratase
VSRLSAFFGALVLYAATALLSAPIADAAPSQNPSSRLDEVVNRGTLRACTTGDYKPYSFQRADGGFEGIDIDLTEALAKSLKVKTVYVKTSWPQLMDDFTSQCDIGVGGISTSLERQKRAFFSTPYRVDGKSPIARCADAQRYTSLLAIDQPGVRVIVNPGGANEKFARQFLTHATLIVYPDNVTIFRQIADGRADVMVTDTSEALFQQKRMPQLCAIHLDRPFQYGEKAYLLPRGDTVFQQYVDQWLHLYQASGELQAVMDKWLK